MEFNADRQGHALLRCIRCFDWLFYGELLRSSDQISVFSSQLEPKDEIQIQNPLFPRFPAYGVFLLKRPKGTKSRRWARGLPYA